MKYSPEYNYLQYVVACAMKWYNMYIICIEINKYRMIIYKNTGRDNIRKKRDLEMCVGSLDHLDNCKSFGVFNIFNISVPLDLKVTWHTMLIVNIYALLKIKPNSVRNISFLCSSLDGIWTHTNDTLQHQSLSLMYSALDHMPFSMSALISSRGPTIIPRHIRGKLAGVIWKRSCINHFIIYTSDKLFLREK